MGLVTLEKFALLGAIIGDIAGSRFEFKPIKTKQFDLFYSYSGVGYCDNPTIKDFMLSSRFTDDSVMSIAVAKALLCADKNLDNLQDLVVENMKYFGRKYPNCGYGNNFNIWLNSVNSNPYNSYGNGSAMRTSAVAHVAEDLQKVKQLSRCVAQATHNHPEGIKGAEAVSVAIWMALYNFTKEEIKKEIENKYYNLNFDYHALKSTYKFDKTCQGSVPQSIFCFLISQSFEDAVRTAISLGGDADTMACIAGSIAAAYYGIPDAIQKDAMMFLPQEFKEILNQFEERFA